MAKRIFSLFLCCVLLLSAVPFAVAAEEESGCEHNRVTNIVTESVNCQTPGTKVVVCSICGTELEGFFEYFADHTFGNGVETKAATCVTPGVVTYTCTTPGCSETKDGIIPVLTEHTFGDFEVTKNPTCAEAGERTAKCTVDGCEETTSKPIDTLSHTDSDWGVTLDPTCVDEGTEVKICPECEQQVDERSINALGHTFGKWAPVDEEVHERVCAECGAVEEAAHTFWRGTCTACGEADPRYHSITVENGHASVASAPAGFPVAIVADRAPFGMEFDHWESDVRLHISDRENPVASFRMPVGDVTVTAVYAEVHPVIFKNNGHGADIDTQLVKVGHRAEKPKDPVSHSGYVFRGWYTDPGLHHKFDFRRPIMHTTVLYAKWVASSDVPKTGDNNNILLWVGGALIGLGAIGYAFLPDNKRKLF